MGYDASFKFTGELDSRFKTFRKELKPETIHEYKMLLVGVCLINRSIEVKDLRSIYTDISLYTRMYISILEDNWKLQLQDRLKQEDGVMYFRGWDYARDSLMPYETVEECTNRTIESLYYIALTPTVNIYEDESKYYDKINRINSELEELDEYIWDIMNLDFYKTYKNAEGSNFQESY